MGKAFVGDSGDKVRIKDTKEVGRISSRATDDTYWVILPSRLFEARFRADELEPVDDRN